MQNLILPFYEVPKGRFLRSAHSLPRRSHRQPPKEGPWAASQGGANGHLLYPGLSV